MLDQLVESKADRTTNRWRTGLLLVTFVFAFTSFASGLVYSLWNSDLFVGGEGLELSMLVAPVPLPEEAPPPEPEVEQTNEKLDIDTRTKLIANMEMSPPKPPDKVSNKKADVPPIRDNQTVALGDTNRNTAREPSSTTGFDIAPPGSGGGDASPDSPPPAAADPPPPPPPPPAVPKRISKGVVNGSAVSLPKPAYPAAARAVNAKGSVNVAIVISKDGSVISANAVSGHPLLRSAAVSAARRARFRPTLLSGQPVEVSGVIVYNFQ
ncbi:MAG: TonB family protein [Acidobacteria bacterium]|nr:MAG: TonB family protein [Acidobacteriota bacterium]REK01919.1 MAG: TonB family protein [Acidobacteriota bacterium]REK14875.1 MAG: TonB family protein [Acidobacteriota bacterium]REK45590.1 MAG: TonB family protein [Acidobacteriota bacterium]